MKRFLDWLLPMRLLPPPTAMIPVIGLGLSGCATGSAATADLDPFCLQDGPIVYDAGIAADTQAAIDQHNRVWVCMCEQDCP